MIGKPSDRQLRRWLRTGRPHRLTRRAEVDATITARLDELTMLDARATAALTDLVTPEDEFEERVIVGLRERREAQGTVSLVTDLLGIGFHVGRAMFDTRPAEPDDDAEQNS